MLDQLELSVTPTSGGDDKVDIKELLSHFTQVSQREEAGTLFYSAHN